MLADHPDQAFVQYILRGIERGFRIGFNPRTVNLRSRDTNLISASEHPEIVGSYLEVERSAGRVIKMKGTGELAGMRIQIHCSPFGVIPKKNKPGNWRLIVDLSSPEGGVTAIWYPPDISYPRDILSPPQNNGWKRYGTP